MPTPPPSLRDRVIPGVRRSGRRVLDRLPDTWADKVRARLGPRLGIVGTNTYLRIPTAASVVITDDSDHAECPLCGTVADTFLPFGIKSVRPDRQCPACGSLERHRLMWLFFALRTDLFTRPQQVLHFAPEGTISVRLGALPNIDYLTADLDPTQAMVQMDITDIDRPDASFDVIFASHVLEHVPDDVQAMRELRRILRPDGWAVLEVPIYGTTTIEDPTLTDPAERTRRFGQHDHVRMYGQDGVFAARLAEAGFDVTVVPLADELGPAATRRFRLDPKERVYLCRPGSVTPD